MRYKAFYRFGPAPQVGAYPPLYTAYAEADYAYADYGTSLPAQTDPDKEAYPMPVKRGDVVKFISGKVPDFNNSLLKIAIIRWAPDGAEPEMVAENAGTVLSFEASPQLYITASIPSNLANGCYRFLLYSDSGGGSVGEWAETGRACETSGGVNTGYVIITEERTVTEGSAAVAIWQSNVFEVRGHAGTRILRYRNSRNAFYFDYQTDTNFEQQVRLPLMINRAKRPVTESVYRQTDGVRRYGNVQMDKKYQLVTGYLDEATHDALAVAVKHSRLQIEDTYYFAAGDFEYDDIETMTNEDRYYELSQGTIEIFEQGYNQQNTTCGYSEDEQPAPDVLPGDNSSIFEGIFE